MKGYRQGECECAVASMMSILSEYNKELTYSELLNFIHKYYETKDGLYAGQIGNIFCQLGFKRVIIVTANIDLLDFHWQKFNNKKQINFIEKSLKYKENKDFIDEYVSFIDFLKNKNAEIKLDNNLKKYIIRYINKTGHMIIAYNWQLFFKQIKMHKNKNNSLRGEYEIHAVVGYDYNNKGIKVLDSNYGYPDLQKKYHKSRYLMEWEKLIPSITLGGYIVSVDGYKYKKI